MKTIPETTESFDELDCRESDGIEVSLLWNRADDSLAVVDHPDARPGGWTESRVRAVARGPRKAKSGTSIGWVGHGFVPRA